MSDTNTQQIVDLLVQLMQVAVLLASLYLVPWIRRWLVARRDQMVASGHVAEVELLEMLAERVVLAIEQSVRDGTSTEKREMAIDWIVIEASKRGVNVSREMAGQLVEAAVRVMSGAGLEVAPATT